MTVVEAATPRVRVSAYLVEDGRLLVVHEVIRERDHWNLPGGAVEAGETIERALAREVFEETGLVVEMGDLLYVCDRFKGLGSHVIDMGFEVRRVGGGIAPHVDAAGDDAIAEVRMASPNDLVELGFSERFAALVAEGFPGRGSYQGDFHEFYGVSSATRGGNRIMGRSAA